MTTKEDIEWAKKYHRLVNYLSAAMLYLKDNFFLEEELKSEHIKDRILGHWGTVPGLNLMYLGLQNLVKKTNQETMFIAGPGHGAPAVLANLILEGTLGEYYPDYSANREGLSKLIKSFSWPGGFPSHTYPGVPGSIHEGGELGYSLGTAFGSIMDSPDLMVAVAIGDGESETGPLAASLHSNKYINPKTDGSVLPIVHLNGYRISGPTILGTMGKGEILSYYVGLGYEPIWVSQFDEGDIYEKYFKALEEAYAKIKDIKENWTKGIPRWPIIILKTMKGWTCPDDCKGLKLQDHNNSHGIPIQDPKNDQEQFAVLKEWLEGYNVNELLNEDKSAKPELYYGFPDYELRIGKCKYALGGNLREPLNLPNLDEIAFKFESRGHKPESSMEEMGEYFKNVLELNEEKKNFRIFSPDESESNKLEKIFEVTSRKYIWPVSKYDANVSPDGRVMEILSEHVLQEWMQGYVLTGKHGILVSYEAFLGIITTQIDQYIKFLKQSLEFDWRTPVSSMNYVATSTGWRQDHNGFTHQNPTLINTLLAKHSDFVSIYFPADVNILLATLEETIDSTECVNLIISGKRELPQWLSIEEAREHVRNGLGEWRWAGNYNQDNSVDVVLASAGDYQTRETLAAAQILREDIPELKFKYINVNELTMFGMGDSHNTMDTDEEISRFFTDDKSVIFNFHGYPEAIQQLIWNKSISNRIKILGYIEKGTTTTPFDMQVQNLASRYHVCINALQSVFFDNSEIENKKNELIKKYSDILEKHSWFIKENGHDIPEVENFTFNF